MLLFNMAMLVAYYLPIVNILHDFGSVNVENLSGGDKLLLKYCLK